jgi:hypothetical protein
MNPYDQAARFAVKLLDALGFLMWLFRASFENWRWTGWLDTQNVAFPGEPERRCDTVAIFERVHGDAPPVAAVIEFMTRPRAESRARLTEYSLRVHREVPHHVGPYVAFEVVTALIHLTGSEPESSWGMKPDGFEGLGLWTTSRVLTFADVDARALLAEIDRGETSMALLAWGPLLKSADDPAMVAEWKRLALREPDERKRREYGGLAKVFANLVGRQNVWFPLLEGMNVEESQVVKEWQREAVVAALREKAIRVLQTKFPGPIPAELETAINTQKDLPTISHWFDQALEAKSLDEVRAAFGLPTAVPRKTPKRRR